MATFDAETLHRLRDIKEVSIRTGKRPESAVVIWVVASGDEVFVRSVKGVRGRWYRDLAAGGPATIELDGRLLEVEALPDGRRDAIDRASAEYLRKYRTSPYAQAMVKEDVLPTTIRLEPR